MCQALCQALYTRYLTESSHSSYQAGSITVLIPQMRTLDLNPDLTSYVPFIIIHIIQNVVQAPL